MTDERNHPEHVLRALGRLPAEDEALVLKAMRDSSELIAPIDGPSDAQWAEHLNEQCQTLLRENERLRTAIKWALGEGPDADGKWFGEVMPEMKGRALYWWRAQLRKMAG